MQNDTPHKQVALERTITATDGTELFVYEYIPAEEYACTVYIISGITGINHEAERELVGCLCNNRNRVVVMHPRGTGYSGGARGDIAHIQLFLDDYITLIHNDQLLTTQKRPVFLYGHSMSAAILLALLGKLHGIGGVILVNPLYKQKKARGMSPTVAQYLKYAGYMLFAPHRPVVNMAGNPAGIEQEADRTEALQRAGDRLLVSRFSMYYMNSVRKLLSHIPGYCREARCPLLLVYGLKDAIVNKRGCDIIFSAWKHPDKQYLLVPEGTHGKTTVRLAAGSIQQWIGARTQKRPQHFPSY